MYADSIRSTCMATTRSCRYGCKCTAIRLHGVVLYCIEEWCMHCRKPSTQLLWIPTQISMMQQKRIPMPRKWHLYASSTAPKLIQYG